MRVGCAKCAKKKLIFYEMRRIIPWKGGRGMGRKPKIFSKNPKILLVTMKKYVGEII